jgi:hypothetical protein
MGADAGSRLRLLAAELRAELPRIDRTVAELAEARERIAEPDAQRLFLDAAAALLETVYTGVEQALARIATTTTGVPAGNAWHRQLLEQATLDLPKVRPAILSSATARRLDGDPAFRHRFRNL